MGKTNAGLLLGESGTVNREDPLSLACRLLWPARRERQWLLIVSLFLTAVCEFFSFAAFAHTTCLLYPLSYVFRIAHQNCSMRLPLNLATWEYSLSFYWKALYWVLLQAAWVGKSPCPLIMLKKRDGIVLCWSCTALFHATLVTSLEQKKLRLCFGAEEIATVFSVTYTDHVCILKLGAIFGLNVIFLLWTAAKLGAACKCEGFPWRWCRNIVLLHFLLVVNPEGAHEAIYLRMKNCWR